MESFNLKTYQLEMSTLYSDGKAQKQGLPLTHLPGRLGPEIVRDSFG